MVGKMFIIAARTRLSAKNPQTQLNQLVQLSEVLDGADHLRGVGVLVVVPGHNLHLIGVEAAKRLPIRLSSTSSVG